jgi:Predicted archaeal kinase (sugar kinase superfamily)
MPSYVTAFCPGHISGYFKPVKGDDFSTTGSIGAGIVINEGVLVRVGKSDLKSVCVRRLDTSGRVIGEFDASPPIIYLMEQFGINARIITECRLPIGAGFGLSAAALMASASAMNVAFDLGLSREECAGYAHESEIVHRTGLGDVAACQAGGRDCRKGPGIGAEITRHFDIDDPVFALNFSSLYSPSVLGSPERLLQVAAAFPGDCPATVHDFFSFSRSFAEKSGLLTPEVRRVLAECDSLDIMASMTMLGNGIFCLRPGSSRCSFTVRGDI